MIALLKLPKTIRLIIKAAGVLLAAAAVWMVVNFIDAKYEAEAEVARLEQVVSDQTEANRLMQERFAQIEDAQAAADAANTELENRRSDYALIQRAITAAKEEEDGEVAPVLRHALDDIGGM